MDKVVLEITTIQRAGLVDLDATWFVQIGLFLLFYLILSLLFFRPYIALLRRREEKTRLLRERAQQLLAQALEIESSLQAMLAEAKAKGIAERRALVEEGLRIRDEIVTAERKRIAAEVQKELQELDDQKKDFLARADVLAKELATIIEERLRLILQ